MSTEPAISQSTEDALRELQTAFDLYRQSKGKKPKGMTDARSRDWAKFIAIILSDPTYPLDSFLADLSVLPPSTSALGAITAWPSMSKERCAGYLRWVRTLESDRAASQKVVLIPGLLEHSPETSVDLLCNISSKNKELRERLASSLLVDSSDKVTLLLTSDSPQDKVPELLKRLLELTEAPKVTAEAKWRIIRITLHTMVARDLLNGSLGTGLLRLIEVQMPSLPPAIKQEMKAVLMELDARLVARFFPSQAPTTEPPLTSAPERVTETAPIVSSERVVVPSTPMEFISPPPLAPLFRATVSASDTPSTITQQLSDWLTTLQQQVTILQELQERIRSLEEQQAHLDNELRKSRAEKDAASTAAAENLASYRAAEEKIRTLEERLREADTSAQLAREQSDSLRRSMTAAVEKEKTLHQELTQQQAKFSQERSELFDRIKTNAERRLEEYRNGLASSFARLFHEIPERRSAVSTETGQVLLTRLHQVIDFLESKGIRVLSGEGDRR